MAGFLVVQTDFGLQDGAVNAMYGVAYQVEPDLTITNLTHEIEPYNIHDASYRLFQSTMYWPAGTVFVSVVDPGVGTERRSVVAKLSGGQYIITPDNGTLTYLAAYTGIEAVRQIDETTQRLPGSSESHTFHGRDVYMFNGARLASGKVSFEELGSELEVKDLVRFPLVPPKQAEDKITGSIDILDIRFGSLWTNIPLEFFKKWGVAYGDRFLVRIYENEVLRYEDRVIFGRSFAQVGEKESVLYINSLLNVGLGINLGSFADTYKIGTGTSWKIIIKKERVA
ncbi:SAM hydrolase/SAM-dependent halogenase family protein [Enterococcus mediterraneensis]|uniref:SAM hydrolase/SAM-dependent halogenase family protein n=1 Tax=Enterococcus mediterraneensis TaxID=2364791 RepID=UPI000F0652C1|nr:S-adenosyl-l-methionine hydroxide adenosyltransferase family protein [Enterococcus mediterraneensis]